MRVPGTKVASSEMSAFELARMLARKMSTSKSTASPPNGSESATAHSLRPCRMRQTMSCVHARAMRA